MAEGIKAAACLYDLSNKAFSKHEEDHKIQRYPAVCVGTRVKKVVNVDSIERGGTAKIQEGQETWPLG
jgi:hypothetical protein